MVGRVNKVKRNSKHSDTKHTMSKVAEVKGREGGRGTNRKKKEFSTLRMGAWRVHFPPASNAISFFLILFFFFFFPFFCSMAFFIVESIPDVPFVGWH